MQDIMTAIVNNRNLLLKQYTEVENELDYLYLEGDEDSILDELDLLAGELIKTSFVNCTPHFLTIEGIGEIPPSGILPRVSKEYSECWPINGVRIRKAVVNPCCMVDLPEPVEGFTFIVSGVVRDALSAIPSITQRRPDVLAPDTGPDAIRNEQGHIVAVRGLVQ